METSNLTYNVDIVMCIDCTGSMQGLIEKVKQNAFNFYPDLKKYCESKDKHIDQMRVRVIGFRDFYADGPKAIESSGFFAGRGVRVVAVHVRDGAHVRVGGGFVRGRAAGPGTVDGGGCPVFEGFVRDLRGLDSGDCCL